MRSHRIPWPHAAQEGVGGAFSSWHQLSSPATSLPWVRVGLGGALCGSFKATFGVLNSLCLSGVHLIWCCGTFPGLLAWGWQEGLLRRWILFLCPRLLVPGSSAQCLSPVVPTLSFPPPTDPDSTNKTPYIFQLSTFFFPNLVVITPSLLRTHYFPAGS